MENLTRAEHSAEERGVPIQRERPFGIGRNDGCRMKEGRERERGNLLLDWCLKMGSEKSSQSSCKKPLPLLQVCVGKKQEVDKGRAAAPAKNNWDVRCFGVWVCLCVRG